MTEVKVSRQSIDKSTSVDGLPGEEGTQQPRRIMTQQKKQQEMCVFQYSVMNNIDFELRPSQLFLVGKEL